MNKVLRIYLLMLVALVVGSCSDGRQAEIIRQAEQIMQEQPDSALHLLQSIPRKSLRGETLARYALIYSMAQDKSGLDVTSDSLLRIAYDYYRQHPEDTLYARSQYYMGLYYSLADSTKEAEDCLRKAENYADALGDYYTQYLALNRLSSEVRSSDASLALEYSKQALNVLEKKCPANAWNKIYLLKDIGKVYILCNQRDSALHYMDMAINNARELKDSSLIGEVLQEKSLVYTKAGDYQNALSLAKEAWMQSPVKSLNLVFCLANCYSDADSVVQARNLYASIINIGDNEHKYVAYRDMSVMRAKEYRDTLIQIYLDSAYECMESIYKQQLRTKAAYYNDVLKLEEDRLQKEQEINRKRQIIWYSVMIIIFIAAISLSALYNIRYRNRQRLEAEHNRHVLQEKYERERHERELRYKDNQISLMRQVIMERYLFRNNIEKQKKSGKHITITPEDWEEIAAFLNSTSDNFVNRLISTYPNLREKDYQFCMLVRLGFAQKDLANIYGIAETSIKQKMVDYKERLNVPSGGQSFRQFVSEF